MLATPPRLAHESPSGRTSSVGYCMGGPFVVLYAALHPRAPLDVVGGLATPVDSHQMDPLCILEDEKYFDVDALVDRVGNIAGEMIMQQLTIKRPVSESGRWDTSGGKEPMSPITAGHLPDGTLSRCWDDGAWCERRISKLRADRSSGEDCHRDLRTTGSTVSEQHTAAFLSHNAK
jgi:hypothetical protein